MAARGVVTEPPDTGGVTFANNGDTNLLATNIHSTVTYDIARPVVFDRRVRVLAIAWLFDDSVPAFVIVEPAGCSC